MAVVVSSTDGRLSNEGQQSLSWNVGQECIVSVGREREKVNL